MTYAELKLPVVRIHPSHKSGNLTPSLRSRGIIAKFGAFQHGGAGTSDHVGQRRRETNARRDAARRARRRRGQTRINPAATRARPAPPRRSSLPVSRASHDKRFQMTPPLGRVNLCCAWRGVLLCHGSRTRNAPNAQCPSRWNEMRRPSIFKTRGLVISGCGLKWPDPRSHLRVQSVKALSDRCQMITMCTHSADTGVSWFLGSGHFQLG